MRNRHRWQPKGGAGSIWDILWGIIFWFIVIFVIVNVVQVGRAWFVVQNAVDQAAQGVAMAGCWTSNVTNVVRADLANVVLPPGSTPVASVTSNGVAVQSPIVDVDAQNDPPILVQLQVPFEVGGWLHVPLFAVTMTASATITSAAYNQAPTAGGGQCLATPTI